jgi:hypothetical protein
MKIDWRSLVIGFLLGACLLMIAAQAQTAKDPVGQYQIAISSNSTFVINTNTGDAWQLFGITSGKTTSYSWSYAGKPGATSNVPAPY